MGKKTNKNYFGKEEEEAVVRFISTDDPIERDKIYREYLEKPLNRMVDSIIKRYKLIRKHIDYSELHADTLSYLLTKTDKFKPSKNKKAYSYYGTICKNYLIASLLNDNKRLKTFLEFDPHKTQIDKRDDLVYYIDNEDFDTSKLFSNIIEEISNILENGAYENKKLNDNEIKVGKSLIEIFTNWELIFGNFGKSPKYNKNFVLNVIREYTNLSTKEIRDSMKKYKIVYNIIKNNQLNSD
jgi:hypothetical protein